MSLENLTLESASIQFLSDIQQGKVACPIPSDLLQKMFHQMEALGIQLPSQDMSSFNNYINKVKIDSLTLLGTVFPIPKLLHYQFPFITSLCINKQKIEAEMIQKLFHGCSSLNALALEECEMTDEAAEELAKILPSSRLIRLFLNYTPLNQNQSQLLGLAIKNHSSLKTLHVNFCCDLASWCEFLPCLAQNHSIQDLKLVSNGINETGAGLAAEMIKENVTLKNLHLTFHLFEDVGYTSLIDALNENLTLKSVDLSENAMSSQTIDLLSGKIKKEINLSLPDPFFN